MQALPKIQDSNTNEVLVRKLPSSSNLIRLNPFRDSYFCENKVWKELKTAVIEVNQIKAGQKKAQLLSEFLHEL